MARSVGKIFEDDIKKSVPNYALIIRLPDSAQSFYKNENLRFSKKNPFDFIFWNPFSLTFYSLELKTVKGVSISFERTDTDTGEIHFHQIKGLETISKIQGTVCGFIIEFRKIHKTIFININDFLKLINLIDKKSFRLSDLDKYNIKYVIIPQVLLKTHYRYDIENFFKNTGLHAWRENL